MEELYKKIERTYEELDRYNQIISYFNQNPSRENLANSEYKSNMLEARDNAIRFLAKLNSQREHLLNLHGLKNNFSSNKLLGSHSLTRIK